MQHVVPGMKSFGTIIAVNKLTLSYVNPPEYEKDYFPCDSY
jgi:hypothetical protein